MIKIEIEEPVYKVGDKVLTIYHNTEVYYIIKSIVMPVVFVKDEVVITPYLYSLNNDTGYFFTKDELKPYDK